MEVEALQGSGNAGIVRIKNKGKLSLRLQDSKIDGSVLASIGFPEITDREKGRLPRGNKLFRAVSATVIYDDPFKITESLSTQTLVDTRQAVRTIVGGRKHSKPQRGRSFGS